jgi:hypothetical protein
LIFFLNSNNFIKSLEIGKKEDDKKSTAIKKRKKVQKCLKIWLLELKLDSNNQRKKIDIKYQK